MGRRGKGVSSLETAILVGTADSGGQEIWTRSEVGSEMWGTSKLTCRGRQKLRWPQDAHTLYNPLSLTVGRTYEYDEVLLPC